MWSLSVLALSSLALVQSFAVGLVLPSNEAQILRMKRSVNAQTQQELASVLKCNTTIFGPSDPGFANATERYMQNIQPRILLSVRPSCEPDVARIVQYANHHNISFYAVSRGHSLTTDAARFTGIEIDLRNLNQIRVKPDRKTAEFQGGVYSYEATNNLWSQGLVTASGTCSCVSILGPALGGGHGLQQGKHGLTSDHIVNLNVVLADGSPVRVNEKTNPDLWWAFRGAGHNFGIVTSFESKVWPDNFKRYFVRTYQYLSSSHDAVFDAVNKFQGNGTLDPIWLASFGLYTMTNLSKTEATIIWTFLYDGPKTDAALEALKPFDQLQPLSVDDVDTPYRDINTPIAGALNGSLCEPNKSHIIGTANLQVYNITTQRAIYDLYNQNIRQHPELGDTRVLVEGYAVKGVKSFRPEDSAVPVRDDNILTYFDVKLNSASDPLIPVAQKWRNQTIDLWNAGQPTRPPTAYVNYAAGYESLEARYGFEPWRLERLRDLKRKYDPMNKFAWYNPIVPV
ncbi:MAG: hypothetical protein LQ345_001358 [Seirophora villosa]|nr:MAG: hypothetical protein LQ345_001358 [Seirophora villosa]